MGGKVGGSLGRSRGWGHYPMGGWRAQGALPYGRRGGALPWPPPTPARARLPSSIVPIYRQTRVGRAWPRPLMNNAQRTRPRPRMPGR